MKWFLKVIKNFNFSGRARRKEYWMFMLVHLSIIFVLEVLLITLPGPKGEIPKNALITLVIALATIIYLLWAFIPHLAVCVKRMHDTNHNGWWMIVPFYGWYLFFKKGDAGANDWGPDPKVEQINH